MADTVKKLGKERVTEIIGWIAVALAVMMYVSFIDQIRLNITGYKGSWILPAAAVLCCSTWIIYGYLLRPRNWQIIVCNIPGALLGLVTAITAVF